MIKVGYVFCLGLHGMSPLLGLTWTNPRSTVPSCCNPRFLRILIPSPSRSRTAWTLPQPPSSCPMASTCRGERDGLMGRVWCSLFGGNEKVDGYCCGKTVWWPVYFFSALISSIFYGLWNVNCWLGSVQFCWFSVGRRGCYHDRAEGRKLEFCAWGLSLFMAEFVLHSLSPAALISWFSNWQGQIVEDASCSDWQGTTVFARMEYFL